MSDPSLFHQMLEQLRKIELEKQPRMPARQAGEIRAGGASEVVLAYLRSTPGFRTEAQIRFATGRSHAAVSWALLFLKGQGLIKAVPDVARNPRYCRYCAVKDECEGGSHGS